MTAEGRSYLLSPVAAGDLAAVGLLNEAAVPAVNSLTAEELQRFAAEAPYFTVARLGNEVAGFLIGLDQTAKYLSPNFQYFKRTFEEFAYVDRVIVGSAARGKGLGQLLYRDFEEWARSRGLPRLTCEVNLRPPNEASLRFHQRAGFAEVGRQRTEGGAKLVALLAKPLTDQ